MNQPIYNKKLTLPEFSDLPSVPPDIAQTSDLQFRAPQPPNVRSMSDYGLMSKAVQDAKAAGVAQMTPEKREHWARMENEYAIERLRRKEKKEAEKKQQNMIMGTGQYVEMGIWTPGQAVKSLKAKGIDYSEEEMAKFLPAFRTERTPPNVMTVDEYATTKQRQAYGEKMAEMGLPPDTPPDVAAEIDLDIAKAESERRIPSVKLGEGEALYPATGGGPIARGPSALVEPETITTTPEESLWERDPETGEWKQRVAGQAKLPTSKQYQVEYWDSAGVKQKRLISEDEYDATMGNILDEGGSLSKPDKPQPKGYQESLVNAFADVKSGIKKEDVFRDLVVLFPEKTLELQRIFWPQTPLNLIIGE